MNKPTSFDAEGADSAPADTTPAGGKSLFERADGAFGLDKLAKPKVPPRDEAGPKLAKPVPPQARKPARDVQHDAADTTQASQPERPEPLPKRKVTARGHDAVSFSGDQEEVSREHLRSLGLLDPELGASALVEEFRIVKRQVLATAEAEEGAKARRILVSSPHPGEGKTFCATNLAIALAGERNVEVVLVDADFGKPSVMRNFGLEPRQGLMDVLRDPTACVEDYVVATNIPDLYLLPAGERSGADAEYVASERTWEVLNRLSRGAQNRYIIFDSPPALAASPAAELAKHVGQVLLVARADRTAKASLEDAADLLSGCDDIRLLLNDTTFNATGRSFGRYYGYGG